MQVRMISVAFKLNERQVKKIKEKEARKTNWLAISHADMENVW